MVPVCRPGDDRSLVDLSRELCSGTSALRNRLTRGINSNAFRASQCGWHASRSRLWRYCLCHLYLRYPAESAATNRSLANWFRPKLDAGSYLAHAPDDSFGDPAFWFSPWRAHDYLAHDPLCHRHGQRHLWSGLATSYPADHERAVTARNCLPTNSARPLPALSGRAKTLPLPANGDTYSSAGWGFFAG